MLPFSWLAALLYIFFLFVLFISVVDRVPTLLQQQQQQQAAIESFPTRDCDLIRSLCIVVVVTKALMNKENIFFTHEKPLTRKERKNKPRVILAFGSECKCH